MNPDQEIENIGDLADDTETNDSVSVDDFIKQLEAKEKDLHITADTTIIEIAESFDDGNLPEFLAEDLKKIAVPPAAPAAAAPGKKRSNEVATDALEEEIRGLKEQISKLDADRNDILQASQRRAKDFENLKSRTERERKETFQNQVGNLATQMLPALDNLNRAVDYALAMSEDKRAEIQPFFEGIVLVNQQVNEVLAEMGVQPIATVGEVFDPHFHEAVAVEESPEFEPDTISAELLRGYRIGDRVIRHSMVKVAKPAVSDSDSAANDLSEQEEVSDSEDSIEE